MNPDFRTFMSCPNEPRCEHWGGSHDMEGWDDPMPRCCFQGCPCGAIQGPDAPPAVDLPSSGGCHCHDHSTFGCPIHPDLTWGEHRTRLDAIEAHGQNLRGRAGHG